MNILYLSENDPRNTTFGGAQRTHFIWETLKTKGNVYSVFFDQQFKTEEIAPRIWQVRKLLKVSPVRYFLYRLERKILKPFNVLPLWSIPTLLEIDVNNLFPNVKFDMVVCRYCFDLMEMHLWNFPKVFVDFDDHPLEMYDTLKCLDVPRFLRPLGRLIVKQQIKFLQKKIDGGWVSNPKQSKLIKCKNGVGLDVLKNISKEPSLTYRTDSPRDSMLMIVGAMSYFPNYSGTDFFLKEIWCKVHEKYPNLELAIIGKGTPDKYIERWKQMPNVKLLGFVDNIEPFYQACLATIVPIYSGGGTCIKTLESLAYSRVCICSPFGARGLEKCKNNKMNGLLIYETSDDFIKILEKYIFDEKNRVIAEKEAKCFINDNYSKESFKQTVLSTIS